LADVIGQRLDAQQRQTRIAPTSCVHVTSPVGASLAGAHRCVAYSIAEEMRSKMAIAC